MNEKVTFEQSLKKLEDAVTRLEKGTIPLDEALSCFEEGVQNANLCRQKLREVELQVKVLVDQADDFQLDDFSRDETPLE